MTIEAWRYTESSGPSSRWCIECGVTVGDCGAHDRWHGRIEPLFVQAIGELPGYVHVGWYSFPHGERTWHCSDTCPHPEHSEATGRDASDVRTSGPLRAD